MFGNEAAGNLVAIRGTDPALRWWLHRAFGPAARGALMPPLTVSPWFETRRGQDYDRLLAVRTDGDCDAFGLSSAAYDTWNVMATDGDQRSCLQIAEAIEARSARASRDLAELWRRLSSRR